jgi:hypothetical protein
LWIDNHLRRTHAAIGDYKTLVADMRIAGSRVADEWEGIKPPAGFDPADADFGSLKSQIRTLPVLGFQRLAAYARIKYEAYDCL